MPIKTISREIGFTYFIRNRFVPKNIIVQNEFHADHISKNLGKPYTWKTNLDYHIANQILEKYKFWLIENGYDINYEKNP